MIRFEEIIINQNFHKILILMKIQNKNNIFRDI